MIAPLSGLMMVTLVGVRIYSINFYFTVSPGGYFNGMVARAKAGNLNLARTIWGLRENPHGQIKAPSVVFERTEFMNS